MSNDVLLYPTAADNFKRSNINYHNKRQQGSISLIQFASETYLEFNDYTIQFEVDDQILGSYIDRKLLQVEEFVSGKDYFVYFYVIDGAVLVGLRDSYETVLSSSLQLLAGMITGGEFEAIEGV